MPGLFYIWVLLPLIFTHIAGHLQDIPQYQNIANM